MSNKISYSELINLIAKESNVPKVLIRKLLKETVNLTKEGLKRDRKVNLSGFGHFNLKWHETKQGRNPLSGEIINIPAQNKVIYKPEVSFRKFINRNYEKLEPKIFKEKIIPLIEDKKQKTPEIFKVDIKDIPKEKEQILVEVLPLSKKTLLWLWFIVPLVLIFIIYFFWISQNHKKSVMNEPKTEEKENFSKIEKPMQKPIDNKALIIQHRIKKGDRIWNIAKTYYKNPFLWPYIYYHNTKKISNPDLIFIGDTIQIHPFEGEANKLSKNDSLNLAKGYFQAYIAYKKNKNVKAISYLSVALKYSPTDITTQYADKIDEKDLKSIN